MQCCLAYQVTESAEQITEGETYQSYKYPTMVKTQPGFKLSVMKGSYNDSQIIVLLGENGTGKTTFIRMLVYLLVLQICFLQRLKKK
jgi:ATP-binding cassette subfamily E protein 1